MKTFQNYITEVFDKPYKWSGGNVAKGAVTPTSREFEMDEFSFNTSDDGTVELIANHWWIGLDKQIAGMKIKKEGLLIAIEFVKNNEYKMTGEGDAMRILATVLDIIKSIIKKHEPMTLIFSADKSQDKSDRSGREKTGRAGAYGAIVKRFAGKMGYKSDTKDSNRKVEWQLTKK